MFRKILKTNVASLAVLIAALLIASAFRVRAHDYWIEADPFVSANRNTQPVTFRLHMGDRFTSEQERPLQLQRTLRFALFSGRYTQDLTLGALDGQLPLLHFTPRRAGTLLIAMERTPQRLELPGAQFDAYLAEQGLIEIINLRTREGRSLTPGRERYTRYLKTLLQVGARRTDDFQRNVGQRLEIIPQRNPYNLRAGEILPFKILFDGRPLKAVQVEAYNRRSADAIKARTDAEGVARLSLPHHGTWLVRLVHMRRCVNCDDVDWESFWAACTFAITLGAE